VNTPVRPFPVPTDTSRAFWDAARTRRLVLQRCGTCARYQYPPDVACVHCQSVDLAWTDVVGTWRLFSYAVVERPFHVGFEPLLPYVVALAELDEQPGLRILANVLDADPADLRIGQALEVTFEDVGAATLPQLRPSREAP